MYAVTRDGKKLPIDDSGIDYDKEYVPFIDNIGVFTDNTILRPIWLVTVQKVKDNLMRPRFIDKEKYEFAAEYKYDHKPTKEELLYVLSVNGCSRYDVVTIDEGFELDEEYDD